MNPANLFDETRPKPPILDPKWSEETLRAILQNEPRRASRARRAVLLAAGAATLALPLAAAAVINSGSEFVDQIPPRGVIMSGALDGQRYWMVGSLHKDDCGTPRPGVEIVTEADNLVGQEWHTSGIDYGRELGNMKQGFCGYDTASSLADPSKYNSGGGDIGDAHLWTYAVHPTVTALQVTMNGDTFSVPTFAHNTGRYAVIEVPQGTESFTVRLLAGNRIIAGSEATIVTPD